MGQVGKSGYSDLAAALGLTFFTVIRFGPADRDRPGFSFEKVVINRTFVYSLFLGLRCLNGGVA